MIELFARTDTVLHPNVSLIPLHIDDAVSSLPQNLLFKIAPFWKFQK